MEDRHAMQAEAGTARWEKVVGFLLLLGLVSSLVYVASEVTASLTYHGYSYVNQSVSELSAIESPTRPLLIWPFTVYGVLVIAFAAGVWAVARGRLALRGAAVALFVYAVVGEVTELLSPMHVRGFTASPTGTDVGHIVLTTLEVLSLMAFVALGSGARGRAFRVYSIATILVLLAGGILTGMEAPHMTAAAASTPWMGILERVNIYGTMLWVAALSLALRAELFERAIDRQLARPREGGELLRVAAVVGSGHRGGASFVAAQTFLGELENYGDVAGEIVALADYDIGTCRGCKACFDRGEEHCPLHDERDEVLSKMLGADAVVFVAPNYSFQVSGLMKVFLDRIGFAFHRPRFHGKTATAIVPYGVWGAQKVRTYLEFAEGGLGFNVVKGSVVHTLEPMTIEARERENEALAKLASRFHERLVRPAFPVPSLFGLMMFRMARTGIRRGVAQTQPDYRYYRDKGWFESEYFYPTHLSAAKKAAGALFDWTFAHTATFEVESPAGTQRPPTSRPAVQ